MRPRGCAFAGVLCARRNACVDVPFPHVRRADGDWRDNQRHGKGVALFGSGLRYQGAWKNDKADGEGACVYPGGDKYSGEWKNDHRRVAASKAPMRPLLTRWLPRRWGWGRYDMVSGDSFEGQWRDDVIHGKVPCRSCLSRCSFNAHAAGSPAPHMQGRYTYADGALYEGEYVEGQRSQVGFT